MAIISCKQEADRTSASVESKNYAEKLNQYFEKLVELKKFNGALFVQKNEEIIIWKNYNIEVDAPTSLNTHKTSQFDIHSISKLMAKAAIVDLEIQNLISSDDFVSKYIQDFPKGDKITIQHLLENQSGLPREFTFEIQNLVDKSPLELVGLIKKEKLLYEPGSEDSYSNLGYQLLYFIIEKVTNIPFVEYLEEQYFSPLRMTNTGAHFHLRKDNKKHLVKNHELNDDNSIAVVLNIQSEDKNQAKLYSNISDLSAFLDHLKKPEYIERIRNKNRRTIGWSGGGDGILSHLEHNFNGHYDLIFFSNYDEIPFGDIVLTIEKIMTNQQYELPKKIERKEKELPDDLLKSFEGNYRMREFNNSLFQFKFENDQFVFYQDCIKNAILKAETDSTFFELPSDEDYFEFRKADNGSIDLVYYYKKVPIFGKLESH